MPYETFHRFYDRAMRDYSWCSEFLNFAGAHIGNDVRSVLELACGTGRILEMFSGEGVALHGLDISPGMLSQARIRLPEAVLHRMSMVGFSLEEKFDLIICLFDSINHVRTFSEWESVFSAAQHHLLPGGTFLLDFNTSERLQRLAILPPFISRYYPEGMMIMDVEELCDREFAFHVELFEAEEPDLFRRHRVEIREYTFPVESVIRALERRFDAVTVVQEDMETVNDTDALQLARNGRIYCICSVAGG